MRNTKIPIGEYVARRIKDLRTHYNSGEGISQEALATHLDVAANTLSRWETGLYRPGLEDMEKLARFFGVSLVSLFPPEEMSAQDSHLSGLLRAARQLHPDDLEELIKYAEFRRARRIYKGRSRPRAGRKSSK
jgi:transcriptional regulator with XRE-family HTH domain